MTAVLVTGASGFVGRPLVAALARAGYDVVAASRRPLSGADKKIHPVRLPDLAGAVDWESLLANVSHVVHLAAVAHRGSAAADDLYEQVNRRAVADLAAAAAKRGVKRLVFVSSVASQSGAASDRVLGEADEPRPTTVYGRTKLAAEADLAASGAAFTILRPVLIYGPDAPGNMGRLMRLAASPLPLPFGALAGRRSLLAVDNLIAAVALALGEPRTAGETFLVADRDALTLPEIVTALRAGLGRKPGLVAVPAALCASALRLAGKADWWDQLGGSLVVSPAKLLAAGWEPVVSTRDGLAASMIRQ
jgi:UDP-glucose 4-epimerase